MTSNDDAVSMARKFRLAEEKVSAERGGFYLFGLFEHEQAAGRFDLVASAPWLKADYAGTQEIIVLLRDNLDTEDWSMVSAVFPLEPSVEYVRWFTQHYHIEHQVEEVYNQVFNGVPISRAFIITANPSPTPAPAQPVAA